ncbi:hypothetical protein N5U20_09890 [Aliarcobacter butzleri]|uniref:hypothetical protein n=1 Tax=Aliarcobacter butzleri TaxID=28197 RepID=UPI001EDA90E2|nr:hypothetical protein [Aliarcobacter butzleri]MCG3701493.1 hypothetical protein [Aliarcobacter butzleri]MCT7564629.1 hypothetical protein [Aliarcobacter butzleri]MCT7613517.1 hypothetical protein [Aliarcobacter butzleri]MCT7622626.1 hypothetical protein [Aliarcobacter butzleri]MCT7642098.1 hypothetical protein [Aliarcobacter butzleri]
MTREEILKEFQDIEGINEAKKIYKTLAKKLHPDIGGSEEEFKLLNEIYNHLIEHKIYFSNSSKIDIELEKIISLILHFENINIELIGSWVWVSGDTKEIKEKLKEIGFKWASKKKMWYYGEMKAKNPNPKSMEEIKAKYGSETLKSDEKKKIAS